MGALLKQVVGGLEEIPEEISQAYQGQKKALGGRGPQLSEIVKMLQTTSSKEHTFICIDALDECVPEHRVRILDSLNEILQKSPGTRIFVTGRPHIRPEIGRRLTGKVTSLSITTNRDDIIRYLHSRMKVDTTPDAMDSSLEEDILKRIPEDISDMYVKATTQGKVPQASTDRYISRFLLVSLNIDAILQETTIHRRRQKLNTMTDGLGLRDAYGVTMDRIKKQGEEKARLGMAALMWISHSQRPLKADELCHALAVEIGSPNLNADNVPSIGTLLACCQGLVVIGKEASRLRLIHFTLQEYLRAHPSLFSAPHSTMAETCLSYLNSQQVKVSSTSPSPDLQDTPFLKYSSLYWGVHARKELSDCAKQLALKLFDDYNNHISSKILLKDLIQHFYVFDFDKPYLFSGLHCASLFGIVGIVACMVEMEGCDINRIDFMGNTPLHWAAGRGREGVVKIILRRGDVNPDKADNCGRTPLLWAAHNGHEEVVKILLGRADVDPNKPDIYNRTPLWWAADNAREGAIKILLRRDDVIPDKPDNRGQTPLMGAVFSGHESVVKMVLARDGVCPDKPNNDGKTPLWWAAFDGQEGIVKILLGRDDVNPDKPDNNGQTPLSIAACYGHEGVVKILLGRDDVIPDKPNINGRTPLHLAAWNGEEGVVKVLLGRNDVNPNKSDKDGNTPLDRATWKAHDEVMALLQPPESAAPSLS